MALEASPLKKADATRAAILNKSFELIYKKGYQNTSIDKIIECTEVTKGAFYYHFKNKDEMGVSIINELFTPSLISLAQLLKNDENPVDAIYSLIHYLLMKNEFLTVEHGCPLANLLQEMTPWNTEFTKVLNLYMQQLTKIMSTAINRGKKEGFVREDVNAKQAITFILSGYQGIRNFGKLENNRKVYLSYLKELKNYLNTLSQ